MANTVDYLSAEMEYAGAKKERKSLSIPKKLAKRAQVVINESDEISSLSQLVTIALADWIRRAEKAKSDKELAEGYRANRELDREIYEEWKYVNL